MMLRTLDIVLIGLMAAAAVVTYSIKHRTDLKAEAVRKLDSDIRLERDTIDLLRADWALLTQPNRLNKLVDAYKADLDLEPTLPSQLALPKELPMLRAQLPQPSQPQPGMNVEDVIVATVNGLKPLRPGGGVGPAAKTGEAKGAKPQRADAGRRTAARAVPKPASEASTAGDEAEGFDETITGSVSR